jgi:hypothetical protein
MVCAQQEALNEHLNHEQICVRNPAPAIDLARLTEAQMSELKKVKRQNGVNDEAQWIKIYKAIFPNEGTTPSPCKFTQRTRV